MMYKVSIIVPVYNVEKYIKKCLDSLVNQTLKEIEMILINDGSKENEETIILEYQKKYSNICYLKKENGGQASARNLGLTKAKGEFILFVDSDDFIEKNMCEEMYQYAKEKEYDIVVSDAYWTDKEKETYFSKTKDWNENPGKKFMMNTAGVLSVMIRSSIAKRQELQFLENRIYEDVATIPAYVLYTKKIGFLKKPYYHYVIRNGSTMQQVSYNPKQEDIFYALEHLTNLFKEKKQENIYKEELEYYYIEHLLHAASLRFYKFSKKEQLQRIVDIMKEKYPEWKNNVYYKQENWKYKVVCSAFYHKHYFLLKLLLKRK